MRKLTYEEVKQYIESFGYKLLSEKYENSSEKLIVQCEEGHIYETSFSNFRGTKNRKGRRCPHCANNIKYTYEFVKSYIEKFNYKLISKKYIGAKDRLLIKCSNGHKYETTFDTFKNKDTRCPHCNGNARRTIEYVREYIEKNNYKLMSIEYTNNEEKLSLICNKGHECEISFGNFQNGKRCGVCNNSKGETKILNILSKKNVDFIQQYRFEDCKFDRTLPFDFYLPDYNCCIEYDGQQHFEPVECFGGEENFKIVNIRDSIKNDYCKKNNIQLIRIPYWEFDNIEEILKCELKL